MASPRRRARWKIENETFNTLKNQGYHFEHNYGHGEQHLSVVFVMRRPAKLGASFSEPSSGIGMGAYR